jgi:hypothetical protein
MNDAGQLLERIGMYHGAILTPPRLRDALIDKNLNFFLGESYGLVGYMSQAMREQIAADPKEIRWRYTVFETTGKKMFFVVTGQSGPFQTRFVMHLTDPLVHEMLQWSGKWACMQVLLGVAESADMQYLQPEFLPEDVEPILQLSAEARPSSPTELMADMALAAVELKTNAGMLRLKGMPPVQEVTVNSVLWTEAMSGEGIIMPEPELAQ